MNMMKKQTNLDEEELVKSVVLFFYMQFVNQMVLIFYLFVELLPGEESLSASPGFSDELLVAG